MTIKLTLSEKIKTMQTEKKKIAEHIAVDYPEAKWLSINAAIKYKKALDTYPDLALMKNAKLILLAYDFRQEQIKNYHREHTIELADARCNIQLGGYKNEIIPEDLLALSFEKECVVCHGIKKIIAICPECWQKIRKCLELKAQKHKQDGWEGWGCEWGLDLQPLIELLASPENKNTSEENNARFSNDN